MNQGITFAMSEVNFNSKSVPTTFFYIRKINETLYFLIYEDVLHVGVATHAAIM